MIVKKGNKWVLIAKGTGKVLGTHQSKKKAMEQERKIQMLKRSNK